MSRGTAKGLGDEELFSAPLAEKKDRFPRCCKKHSWFQPGISGPEPEEDNPPYEDRWVLFQPPKVDGFVKSRN